MTKLKQEDVLRYSPGRSRQLTVRRHYIQWRADQNPSIPIRCDNTECIFYSNPLIWNGRKLKPTLDHINGVSGDNSPKNLRLLCPNCASQLPTQGGGNKGRVEQHIGDFAHVRNGKRHYTFIAEPGSYTLQGKGINF